MKVMLSCGTNSEKIIMETSKSLDNVDFLYFASVDEFIHQSRLRHLAFDRLIFTNKFASSDEDMSKLCDFVRNEQSGVTVVMILSKTQANLEVIFKTYFDSPMYTLMYIDRPTAKCMVDAVKLPIVDLSARYYLLDKPKESKGKNSKFGLFKGGKKNKSQKPQTGKNPEDDYVTSPNGGENEENNYEDVTGKNSGLTGETDEVDGESSGNLDNGDTENSSFGFDGFSPDGDGMGESNNFDSNGNDMDLSIGDYGMMHSDSGFVGDDELSELEEYARNRESGNVVEDGNSVASASGTRVGSKIATPVGIGVDGRVGNAVTGANPARVKASRYAFDEGEDNGTSSYARDDEYSESVEEGKPGYDGNNDNEGRNGYSDGTDDFTKPEIEEISEIDHVKDGQTGMGVDIDRNPKEVKPVQETQIVVCTGLRGSDVTPSIAQTATEDVSRGMRVLIVDLDIKANGILGFITDVKDFYSKAVRGISSLTVYTDDGIDIISNGYGEDVTLGDVAKLEKSGIFGNYDRVYIDCPLDCLQVIPDRVFKACYVDLYVVSDISKYIETSIALEDRGCVSLQKELHIIDNRELVCEQISDDDKAYLKDIMLFPYGSWI